MLFSYKYGADVKTKLTLKPARTEKANRSVDQSGQLEFSTVTTESEISFWLSTQLLVSTVDLSGQVEFSTVTT